MTSFLAQSALSATALNPFTAVPHERTIPDKTTRIHYGYLYVYVYVMYKYVYMYTHAVLSDVRQAM